MAVISRQKGKRTVAANEDDDRILIIEREKEVGKWYEFRVTLTREEIAKLAKHFPVQLPETNL